MKRERFEDVSKVLVRAANGILIVKFLVGIVTIHGPVFLFLFIYFISDLFLNFKRMY